MSTAALVLVGIAVALQIAALVLNVRATRNWRKAIRIYSGLQPYSMIDIDAQERRLRSGKFGISRQGAGYPTRSQKRWGE